MRSEAVEEERRAGGTYFLSVLGVLSRVYMICSVSYATRKKNIVSGVHIVAEVYIICSMGPGQQRPVSHAPPRSTAPCASL